VPVRIQKEPHNPVDARAMAFECLYDGKWEVIGYVVSELIEEVTKALDESRVTSVKFAWIRYCLNKFQSGPGFLQVYMFT
jgi:hypothetical protein